MTENYLDIVKEVRAKYPAIPTRDECVLITNEIAWRIHQQNPEWGISAKTSGTRGRLPNGQEIAEDALHHRTNNWIVDVLGRAGSKDAPSAVPQWNPTEYHNDPQGRPWLKPFDPAVFQSAPTPAPQPAPQPAPAPLSETQEILSALKALTGEVASLRTEMRDGAAASVRVEQRLRDGIPLRIKSFLGKIVGTVGGE